MSNTVLIIIGLSVQVLALILAGVVAYNKAILWLGDRLTKFETMLAAHAQQLAAGVEDMRGLTHRMEKTEQRHFDLAQDLQRLIGRVESRQWDGAERRREA